MKRLTLLFVVMFSCLMGIFDCLGEAGREPGYQYNTTQIDDQGNVIDKGDDYNYEKVPFDIIEVENVFNFYAFAGHVFNFYLGFDDKYHYVYICNPTGFTADGVCKIKKDYIDIDNLKKALRDVEGRRKKLSKIKPSQIRDFDDVSLNYVRNSRYLDYIIQPLKNRPGTGAGSKWYQSVGRNLRKLDIESSESSK